jgi:hypothetical protein
MSDDPNVISLSDRARLRKAPREGAPSSTGSRPGSRRGALSDGATPSSASGARADGSNAARSGSAEAGTAGNTPVPARLVWLYCATCQTLEYTEMLLPNGRVHQPCGTRVEEVDVEVDARAEYSLAELNLRQLDRLAELVEGQRGRFREYQQRLELAAHRPLSSYPLTEDTVRVMPVAEVDPLGLLISAFLREPLKRFRPDAAVEAAPDSRTSERTSESEGTLTGSSAPDSPGSEKPQT